MMNGPLKKTFEMMICLTTRTKTWPAYDSSKLIVHSTIIRVS